ncbi:DUF4188 domain-containing protein [Novosphingobium olei]|uniref:DUF4188 domain-containing protein n=1 Tax=Novosphingobium olei TaxID=2728851 RepID=UPI001F0CE307|nr:DUF4188 domain-containing protein [Novosphingobium olei]
MPNTIHPGRFTANHRSPLTVFMIGMRINKLHRIDKWWPVARAMRPMIAELSGQPDSGFLGAEVMRSGLRTLVFLQYWRSFDDLERFATDRSASHLPAWKAFYRKANSGEAVGIFHETYCVDPGRFETVYGNMPAFGLGRVAGLSPAGGARNKARARMSISAGSSSAL